LALRPDYSARRTALCITSAGAASACSNADMRGVYISELALNHVAAATPEDRGEVRSVRSLVAPSIEELGED